MQLYPASTWQMEIICREDERLTVTGGIGDRDFGHWMKTLQIGETFEAPEAVIARGKSLYDVCDKLVKAQHPDISPVDSDMGIVFNEYCATWGDPTFEKIKKVAATLGITLDEMKAMLDHRDIAISENKVSIHENGIPFRLKGKAARPILSTR